MSCVYIIKEEQTREHMSLSLNIRNLLRKLVMINWCTFCDSIPDWVS